MLPFIICGCITAAGLGLLGKTCRDYRLYRLKYGPRDHWMYRGRRIGKGKRVYFPDTGETVTFTGRDLCIRRRSGREDRITVSRIPVRYGRACFSFTRR